MNHKQTIDKQHLFSSTSYVIQNFEDEIRADQNCQALLKLFLQYLHEDLNIDPLTAGTHARGADYFLRDFVIDHCRRHIFSVSADEVNAFAGHWYIVNTLEANMKELEDLLEGIRYFYRFCRSKNLLDDDTLGAIETSCDQLHFYRQRIDSFNALKDNEFQSWNKLCSLP